MNMQDPHSDQPVFHAGAPLESAQAALVLLHGRGAGASDILGLAGEIHHPAFAYLAPQAAQSTWYPHPFTVPTPQNQPWLDWALNKVNALLDELQAAGLPPERTLLLGFSQGACLALEFAYRNPRRFGGLAGLSGGLIGAESELPDPHGPQPAGLSGVPVFLGCSDPDPHIPAQRVRRTGEVFSAAGAQVTLRLYPNLGHTVNLDELQSVKKMMDFVLT